jgi:hypothetical protein
VPIHSHLIEIDLTDYVMDESHGESLLFPQDKHRNVRSAMGDAVSNVVRSDSEAAQGSWKTHCMGFGPTVATRPYQAYVNGETWR